MFEELTFLEMLVIVIDILLVAYVIYKLIMVIRGTRAVQLVKGITVILAVWFFSRYLGLNTLQWIMQQAVTYGLLAIIIIFSRNFAVRLNSLEEGGFSQRVPLLKKKKLRIQLNI